MDPEIIKLGEQNNYLHQIIDFQDNNTKSIFQQFAENIDDVFWLRADNEIIYINPAFEKVWGISSAEIYQKPQLFIDSIHPDYREKVEEILNFTSYQKTGLFEYEYRIIRPDKQIRWVHTKFLPIANDKGEIVRQVGVASDITGQKKSLEETGLLAEMLDVAPNSITIHDHKGTVYYANQKTFEIHGYSREEFMALNISALYVPASAELIEERIKAIQENGQATFEVEHFKKDGGIIPLEVFVKMVDWKGSQAMLSVATDISERKKNKQALKANEEKFRTFVENANDIIYQITPDGIFTYVSPNWTEILGYPLHEVIGENFDKFVHPDDLPRCKDFLYKTFTTGEKQSGIEYRVKHKDNTWRWHNSNSTPLKDENGNIVSFLGVARDVTEKKQSQQKLLLSETKYKAAFLTSPDSVNINKLNGEFIEINEGFTRLTGFTEDELLGKLSSEINIWAIPEDRVKFIDVLKNKGIVENFESLFRSKNGKLIPALLSASIIDINNEPHILSVTRDITDRKNYEQEIKQQNEEYEALNEELRQTNEELISARQMAEESAEKYRLLHENAGLGIGYYTPDGIVISFNVFAASHMNSKPENFTGKSIFDLYPPQNAEIYFSRIKNATLSDAPAIYEDLVELPNENKWFLSTFTKIVNSKNDISGIQIISQDITGQKKLQTELIEAKEKAEENERRVRSMFSSSNAGFVVIDLNGKLAEWNETFQSFFGYESQEFEKLSTKELTYPDDLANSLDNIYKVKSNQIENFRIEKRFVRKDKSVFWADLFASPLKRGNTVIALLGVVNDISDRKSYESELILAKEKAEENEALLKVAMENSQAGIAIAECPTGKLKFVNRAGLLIRQKEYDEIVKDIDLDKYVSSWQILHFDGTPYLTDEVPLARAVLYGEKCSKEFIVRRDNKEDRYVLANAAPVFNKSNVQTAAIVIFLDITERKITENELIKKGLDLKKVQEIAHLGSWYLNIATNNVTWTEELYKMYGFDPDLPPPSYTEHMKLFTSESWEILSSSLAKTRESGIPYELELKTIRKDGTNGWLWVRGEAVTDENNKIIGLWGAAQDITERIIIQEQIQSAKEKAEESDRLKTAFLQNMSHEIRTPMNAIMGFSELLLKNFDNKEKLQKFVSIINQRCSDLLVIINDILDIAKIESGQLQLSEEKVNITKLLQELEAIFNEQKLKLNKANISIVLNNLHHSSELNIITDRSRLMQIFTNLIGNALKYTFQGKIEFGYNINSGQQIEFYVSDSGIGIPTEMYEVIFERFIQLNPGTSRYSGGNGLGLAITKGLVKMLGGSIWLQSELEKGTTFNFTIKTVIDSDTKYSKDNLIELVKPDIFNGETILVVEDDEYNTALIKEILDNCGLNLIFTESGLQSIKMCLNIPFDIVLMDIGLPDISGYEAITQILSNNSNIKIIAQTAFASSSDKNKALNSGCIDYISKPLKSSELIELIKKHI